MNVQSTDGRVHELRGKNLPDSISLYTGVPYRGAHAADVLLSPKDAKGTPFLADRNGWLNKRDAFFVVFGMITFRLVVALAEAAALALT